MKTITTQSMWQQFITCRKAYEWRYVHRLVPNEKPETLAFGSLIHECLEAWHSGQDIMTVKSIIDSAYPEYEEADRRNWHYAHAMMDAYSAKYPSEEFVVLGVEQQFEGAIINPRTRYKSHTFSLAGKIDGIVTMDDEHYLLEHKTAAAINGAYLDRLWVDFQIIVYSEYIQRALGIEIAGVIYNILTKPKLRQGQGETEEEFEARRAELLAKSKTGKTSAKRHMPESDEDFRLRLAEKYNSDPLSFHREIIPISSDARGSVMQELWDLCQALLEARRHKNYYPNRSSCFRFNRPCDYFELCRSNGNSNIIENCYEKRDVNEELAA